MRCYIQCSRVYLSTRRAHISRQRLVNALHGSVQLKVPSMVLQVLMTKAAKYSKGILSEILEFVMGQGLIPADGEVWKTRRRCVRSVFGHLVAVM